MSEQRATIDQFVSRNITTRLVREFVRETIIPDAIERMRAIGHGEIEFPQAIMVPGGKDQPGRIEIVDVQAPASVQVSALAKLVDIGAPRVTQGNEGVKMIGVIAIGTEGPELQRARELAAQNRVAERGLPPPGQEYKPPPGHRVMVIEDDLTGTKRPPSPDDATSAAPAVPPSPIQSKARELAAKRRAKKKKS